MPEKSETLVLTVLNQPGVLVRIAHTFARRGVNIQALHVAPTGNEAWSVMTIIVDETPKTTQIIKHLEKLVDVKSVELESKAS